MLPIARFGFELFGKLLSIDALAATQAGAFISPLSIYVALALLLNGATPKTGTYTQVWDLLSGASPTKAHLAGFNDQARRLLQQLNRNETYDGKTVSELVVANSVWTNNGARVLPSYATSVESHYSAVARRGTAADINKWASAVTRGLVEQAVPPGMPFDIAIVNAVYFLGSWQHPFNASLTTKQDFHVALPGGGKGTVEVDMMSQTAKGDSKHPMLCANARRPARPATADGAADAAPASGGAGGGAGVNAIKLPYLRSTLSAIAVLPDEEAFGFDAGRAARELDLGALLGKGAWGSCGMMLLSLPRFNASVQQLRLNGALQAMGAVDAFSSRARLSALTRADISVSDVLHSAVIRVDEIGTVAAAVTSIGMGGGSSPPPHLKFDRPFIFMVADEASGAVLFLGIVKDPSKGA